MRTPLCPRCGYIAGLCAAPREVRTPATFVRCFSCWNEAPLRDWLGEDTPTLRPPDTAPPSSKDTTPRATARSQRGVFDLRSSVRSH